MFFYIYDSEIVKLQNIVLLNIAALESNVQYQSTACTHSLYVPVHRTFLFFVITKRNFNRDAQRWTDVVLF